MFCAVPESKVVLFYVFGTVQKSRMAYLYIVGMVPEASVVHF